MPEVIVAIVGFIANSSKCCIDWGDNATGNQQRQKLHIILAHSCIFDEAQPQGAKTFKSV
jgi:hypothetical protein